MDPESASILIVAVENHARVLGDIKQFTHAFIRPFQIQQLTTAGAVLPRVEEESNPEFIRGLRQAADAGEVGSEAKAAPRLMTHRQRRIEPFQPS